jgi:hypothetical protein
MKVHQYGLLSAPTMSQDAASNAIEHGEPDVQAMLAEYSRRRHMFVDGLNRLGLPCAQPQGPFYAFPSIAGTGMTSDAFAERCCTQGKVRRRAGERLRSPAAWATSGCATPRPTRSSKRRCSASGASSTLEGGAGGRGGLGEWCERCPRRAAAETMGRATGVDGHDTGTGASGHGGD